MAARGFFVTGTDTGIGKTLVACALLQACVALGCKAVGMKPVAAGAEPTEHGWHNEDVAALLAASNVDAPRAAVNPYCFEPAIAPHIAAQLANTPIVADRIEESFRTLAKRADVVVVEGVGGFLVPLGPDLDTALLARRLALPVILVVGMRLGCLNHALLTAEAIGARGLSLHGWVANHIDPDMLNADRNVEALEARLPAPCLARVPYGAGDPAAVAALLHSGAIFASVGGGPQTI